MNNKREKNTNLKQVFKIGEKSASEIEWQFYKRLIDNGFAFTFNEQTFIIDGMFEGCLKNYRDCKYTPDFIISFENRVIVVEIKGRKQGDNSLRYRLADRLFKQLGYEFYVLTYRGSLKLGTKGFYNYSAGFKKQTQTISEREIKLQKKKEFFKSVLKSKEI